MSSSFSENLNLFFKICLLCPKNELYGIHCQIIYSQGFEDLENQEHYFKINLIMLK